MENPLGPMTVLRGLIVLLASWCGNIPLLISSPVCMLCLPGGLPIPLGFEIEDGGIRREPPGKFARDEGRLLLALTNEKPSLWCVVGAPGRPWALANADGSSFSARNRLPAGQILLNEGKPADTARWPASARWLETWSLDSNCGGASYCWVVVSLALNSGLSERRVGLAGCVITCTSVTSMALTLFGVTTGGVLCVCCAGNICASGAELDGALIGWCSRLVCSCTYVLPEASVSIGSSAPATVDLASVSSFLAPEPMCNGSMPSECAFRAVLMMADGWEEDSFHLIQSMGGSLSCLVDAGSDIWPTSCRLKSEKNIEIPGLPSLENEEFQKSVKSRL